VTAPFGRRLCEVAANRDSGGYRVVSLVDREGPEPEAGQFYMLAAAAGWGDHGGRAFLPRAISVAETTPAAAGLRLDFLLDAVGPGTERLCGLDEGDAVWLTGPLGNSFAAPREVSPGAAGAVLVGGGVGVAPLALLRRRFAEHGVAHRVLLGFRDRAHTGGLDLFCGSSGALCPEVRLATEDGHAGHQGLVTDLLLPILAGDDAASAVVYSCGPPAMLEAVAALCSEHDVSHQIADESPMACGFGACFGCAVPKPDGSGYIRLCVDGPVLSAGGAVGGPIAEEASATGGNGGSPAVTGPADRSTPVNPVTFCGIELEHPVINASGTYDAIAAYEAFGDELFESFPFAAFVSKTITPEPRAGNAPRRIWEVPSGMLNSIGLPNKGLDGFLAADLPRLAELPVPLIVSIMSPTREDFARCVERVAARREVAAVELNVSCPNVHSGLIVGEDPSETEALMDVLRPLTEKPLIVKLTPNVADPAAVAAGAERGGADAVSLINTLKGAAIDPATGAEALGNGYGGLSGPAVRPVALEQLRAVRARVGLPIVGMGGISSGADAAEFIALGAGIVAVGTENFRDPRAGSRIAAELELGRATSRRYEPALDLD